MFFRRYFLLLLITCQGWAARPGTDPKTLWAQTPGQKTRLGILFLHGFSASPDEIAPTLEGLGQNVFLPRLTGHGADGAALAAAKPEDWMRDADTALEQARKLGEKPIVIGCSMGAMLALRTALKNSDVAGLVLISPNYAPKDKKARLLLWPGGLTLAKWINGPERRWEPENPEQARIWTNAYPLEAVQHMMELVEEINSLDLSALNIPSLTLFTEKDGTVDVERIKKGFEKLGGAKKLVAIDSDDHVLAGAATSPGTTEKVRTIIREFLNGI